MAQSNMKQAIAVEGMLEMLEEAASFDYSLYEEILRKILAEVPAEILVSLTERYDTTVYGEDY